MKRSRHCDCRLTKVFKLLSAMILSCFSVNIAAAAVVDVMLVYDTSATTWVGSHGGMTAFSLDAVNRMNQAMQNSGIQNHSFRLVHAMSVGYSSTSDGSTGLSSDLYALQAGTGELAAVHTARETYGADLVAMLVDTGSAYGYVGVGYLLGSWSGSPGYAFTVNAIQAVNFSHTLTHEIGHNLGAHHSKYQTSSPGPNTYLDGQYSAGWYFTGANGTSYHTIMAYNMDGYGNYYQSAPLFSTPLVFYQGTAAGSAQDGDNVMLINQTAATVAAYRDSGPASTLTGLAVSGPASVNETSTASYTATASWSDGTTSTVTPTWSENSEYTTINSAGVLTASSVPSNQTVTISASYTDGGITKSDTCTVTVLDIPAAPTLGEALDNISLNWTTAGSAGWFGQSTTAYYGGAAAQSGDIDHGQSSYIQTVVSGPGVVSFYWKVSSERSYDFLRFYIDGVEQAGSISGFTNWALRSFDIGSGTHTLRWEYTKDGSVSSGSDCGWIDLIVWSPSALTGLAINGPASVDENSTASYTATAGWSDGTTSIVTPIWSENSVYTTINSSGVLTASSVPSNQTVTISASYTYGGITKTDTKTVAVINEDEFPWALFLPAMTKRH